MCRRSHALGVTNRCCSDAPSLLTGTFLVESPLLICRLLPSGPSHPEKAGEGQRLPSLSHHHRRRLISFTLLTSAVIVVCCAVLGVVDLN